MSIKVLVVDDHEAVRAGVKALLAGSDVKIVAEAASGDAAARLAAKHAPDVVLLDIRMPDGDGLTALSRLKLEKPDLPVLLFSAFDNPTYSARAVALGGAGLVLKGAGRDELLSAIRAVAKGGTIWSRDALRRMSGALATPRLGADIEVPLTNRENEVLQQLTLGLTNKQIAHELHISYETVKEHVQHILHKIGVADRTQAALWAVRHGLA